MVESPTIEQQDKLVLVETIGSVLWFIMDGFWMLNQAFAAKAMVIPTFVVNLLVFRWMVGDLDKDPRPITAARVLFALGIGLLGLAVGGDAMHPERLTKVLAHF